MERAEAIRHIRDVIAENNSIKPNIVTFEQEKEALYMAIEALSKPVVDITKRDLCADISCTDCPFMKETCKLMDYVAYADRPHGEWIEREDWNGDSYYDCSVCGESFVLCDGTPSMNLYHYCPNCGADMRKEKE